MDSGKIKEISTITLFENAVVELNVPTSHWISSGPNKRKNIFFKLNEKICFYPFKPKEVKIICDEGDLVNLFDRLNLKIEDVSNDGTLYRIGTMNRSTAAEAQYWSLENPSNITDINIFPVKYGIPVENLKSGDLFIEIAKPKPNVPLITREAPGVGSNSGGSIEIVVPENGVSLESFHTLNFRK